MPPGIPIERLVGHLTDGLAERRLSRWSNPSARIPVPEPAALAVVACLRADRVS